MSAMTARNVGTFSPVWRLIIAAACTVIALDAAAMGSRQAVQKTAAASSEAAQIEPEAMLVKTLVEIRNNRLEAALAEVDKVIRSYPNFRLAHLIKGDLLLARSRPLRVLAFLADATYWTSVEGFHGHP